MPFRFDFSFGMYRSSTLTLVTHVVSWAKACDDGERNLQGYGLEVSLAALEALAYSVMAK